MSPLAEPEALVFLGATADKALLGSAFRVTQHRCELLDSERPPNVAATIHPPAILRQGDDESRYAERAAFADDLRVVVRAIRLA
jgi:uracil-DNA glycosylase